MAIAVLLVSVLAYERKRNRRYLLLSVAFFFLFLSQFSTLLEAIFMSDALINIPIIGLHLSHVLDFFTLAFFLLSMTGYGQNRVRRKTIEESPFSGPGTGSPIVNWYSRVKLWGNEIDASSAKESRDF
jgi:hypothetical protein